MAAKIARATGNLTAAATWGVVDATSLLDVETNNTATTTTYVESATFTPGAIIIDGIAVKVRTRSASPSGTFSIRLAQAGATVAGTEVTINVADIATDVVDYAGPVLVQFAAVTLVAATLYTVSIKSSVNGQVTCYRDATAGNWCRMLRTTTTGAPVAGDDLFILGQWTAAGVKTNVAVTMDSTAATDYGSAVTTRAGFGVGNGGSLVWANAAATNYILQVSAIVGVWFGGIWTMGGVGTECPRNSTMTLQLDCAAAGDFGLFIFGTFTAQGLSRTIGKNVVQCLLNVDAAAAATTLNVNTDTGWLNADDIAIATTTRTTTQSEARTLNANAGASSMVVSAGLTNAHSGTSPIQAEVILLTRNVKIRAVTSAALYSFISIGTIATVDCDWVEFRYLGGTSGPKRGIEINTTTGTTALSYCSWREPLSGGILTVGSTWNNLSIDNLVAWSVSTPTGAPIVNLVLTTGTNWSVTDSCFLCNQTTNFDGLTTVTVGGTLARLRIAGFGGNGLSINPAPAAGAIRTTWTDFELHGNNIAGLAFQSSIAGQHLGKISNVNVWRNFGSQGGIAFFNGRPVKLVIEGGNVFGNFNYGIGVFSVPIWLELRNMTLAGDTTFAQPTGLHLNQANNYYRVTVENCTFGVAGGIKVAHSVADIAHGNTFQWVELELLHCLLSSGTPILSFTANAIGQSYIRYQRVNQASGVHKTQLAARGTLTFDTTTFRTAAPSEKLTPTAAALFEKVESSIVEVPVDAAQIVTVSAWVQKDASYNGNPPRLIAKANPALGQTTDLVLDTFTLGSGVWEQLAGALPSASEAGCWEIYVDCDGTAGNVFVDDYTAS